MRTLFAVVVASGLSVSAAFAQNYYPPANNPIDGNASLLYLEDLLDGVIGNGTLSTKSLIVPTPAGKTLVTVKELQAVLQAGVSDAVDGTPIAGGVTLQSLVGEVSKYNPKKTGIWMTAATEAILAGSSSIALDLETAASAASAANPQNAKNVVKSGIKLIATESSTDDVFASDIVEQAVINAAIYADKIVGAAMAAAKKMDAADVALEMREITKEAVQEAIGGGALYLLDEIMASAAKGAKGLTSVENLVDAALVDAGNVPNTKEATALVMLGVARGLGVSTGAVAEANLQRAGFSAYVTKAGEGFETSLASGDKDAAGGAIDAYIDANPAARKDFIAALVSGGTAAFKGASEALVQVGLNNDFQHSGANTTEEIVEAVVGGNQKAVAKIAEAAVAAGNVGELNHLGLIARGAAKAADITLLGAVVSKEIKATAGSATQVKEIVDFAIQGAVATGKSGAITDITLKATKASKLGSDVVTQGVLSSPVGETYRAVIGAMAGDKKNAAAIKTTGLNARLDDSNDAISAGADVVQSIQANVKGFYNATLDALLAPSNNTQIETEAIVTGASYANPKGVAAIASAAIVKTGFSTVAITSAATNANRKLGKSIELATAAAIHIKTLGSADLFEYVAHTVFQNPKFAADVVTGAVVADPGKAHFTGHAAAFVAPGSAKKIIPALFAYSQLDNHITAGQIVDAPSAAAAIVAGVTNGVLEGKLDPTDLTRKKEGAALKAAVSAAVKAAIALQGVAVVTQTTSGTTSKTDNGPAGVITGYISQAIPGTAGQNDIPGGATGIVGSVITAAVKAAKEHALSIAQAAATAIVEISDSEATFTGAQLAQAVLNAKAKVNGTLLTLAQIQAAVTFGKNQAAANVPGAGAAGVLNYSHHSGTGAPVTSIFDL